MAKKRKVTRARGRFSDKTRAQIFAWDRAVCALTGANLWMLDYGLSGLEQEDWADHIKPVARGGKHVAENGVCASADANFTKNANGRANEFWFIGGRPTYRYFGDVGKVPAATATWLRRDIKSRDWYFNHSVRNFLYVVADHAYGSDGYKRGGPYYRKATLRFLKDFRTVWQSDHDSGTRPTRAAAIKDWQARGLIGARPWPEQREILELLDLDQSAQIDQLAARLAGRYKRNCMWIEKMDRWTRACDPAKGRAILAAIRKERVISPLVKDLVAHNITVLSGLPKPPREEAGRATARRRDDYE